MNQSKLDAQTNRFSFLFWLVEKVARDFLPVTKHSVTLRAYMVKVPSLIRHQSSSGLSHGGSKEQGVTRERDDWGRVRCRIDICGAGGVGGGGIVCRVSSSNPFLSDWWQDHSTMPIVIHVHFKVVRFFFWNANPKSTPGLFSWLCECRRVSSIRLWFQFSTRICTHVAKLQCIE